MTAKKATKKPAADKVDDVQADGADPELVDEVTEDATPAFVVPDDLEAWAIGHNVKGDEKTFHQFDPSCPICRPNEVHRIVAALLQRGDADD